MVGFKSCKRTLQNFSGRCESYGRTMGVKTMNELKPCPFCGSYDIDFGYCTVPLCGKSYIRCGECGCFFIDDTKPSKMIEKWNRRVKDNEATL